jgi:hypothetical protein
MALPPLRCSMPREGLPEKAVGGEHKLSAEELLQSEGVGFSLCLQKIVSLPSFT